MIFRGPIRFKEKKTPTLLRYKFYCSIKLWNLFYETCQFMTLLWDFKGFSIHSDILKGEALL